MASFRFIDDCETGEADAAPDFRDSYWLRDGSPRMPAISPAFERRDWRGFLDARTAAELRASAESGAALDALQGATPGAALAAGVDRGASSAALGVVVLLGALYLSAR